jgi:hypothetical protein
MNIKHKLIVLILLFAIIGMGGCRENEEAQSNEDVLITEASVLEQENLPEWLLIKINEIESLNSKDSSIVRVNICQGEWNEQIVYLIKNNLSSCMFCEVYYGNGEKIVFKDNLFEDFSSDSKNWKIIYDYGNGLEFTFII